MRARALQFQKLIALGLDVSDVASGLLDPRFDLASWLDEHDPEARGRGSETVAAGGRPFRRTASFAGGASS